MIKRRMRSLFLAAHTPFIHQGYLLFQAVFALQPVFEEVKQEQGEDDENPNQQERIYVPQVWQNDVAQVRSLEDGGHDLRIGEPKEKCACQQSKNT